MTNLTGDNIVFVLSMGRSGSTYILQTFNKLTQEFSCYKNEWNVVQWYHKILDSSQKASMADFLNIYQNDPKRIDTVTEALIKYDPDINITLEGFISIISDIVLNGKDTTFIIKTTDLHNLWLYKELFKSAKFIINIRNPVDFLHSYNLFWAKIEYPMFPAHWDLPVHVSALKTIEDCFFQAWLNTDNERCIVVRLEDINPNKPDLLLESFSNIFDFTCKNPISVDKYKNLISLGLGRNSASRIQGKYKENEYARIGLIRAEKIMLKRSRVYIERLYPGLITTIENKKSVNLISRFYKYETLVIKDNRRQFYYLRVIKRILSLFREIFNDSLSLRSINK